VPDTVNPTVPDTGGARCRTLLRRIARTIVATCVQVEPSTRRFEPIPVPETVSRRCRTLLRVDVALAADDDREVRAHQVLRVKPVERPDELHA
jgi:hypothetical protein